MRSYRLTWAEVARHLQQPGGPAIVTIAKHEVEHPRSACMVRSLGLPVGQFADWRMPAPGCHGLHVREFLDRYTAHVDHVNPNCDLPGHLAVDAPAIGSGVALGALIGLAVGESAGAMLLGALIGGALGGALTAAHEAAVTPAPTPQSSRR